MKKNLIKLSTILLLSAMSVSPILAAEVNNDDTMTITIESTSASPQITVNGEAIEASVISIDGKLLLPVRAVAQALDIMVGWNNETKSITLNEDKPSAISFKIGEDGYTFARTAPMPLGQAPVIQNDLSYVPTEVFSDLLKLNVYISENLIAISNAPVLEETKDSTGVVTEISESEILFEDSEAGLIRLNISDDTKLADLDGNELSIEDIAVGDELSVTYSLAMTMSIPPMTNATSIVLNKATDDEQVGEKLKAYKVTVVSVDENQILIDNEELGNVRLNVTDKVQFIDEEGNKLSLTDIKEGDKLEVVPGKIMTKSMPPINTPISIVKEIYSDNEVGIGMVSSVEGNTILFNDEVKGLVSLNISEDTKIVDTEKNKIELEQISEGTILEVVYGNIMTASLPPINTPISITIR